MFCMGFVPAKIGSGWHESFAKSGDWISARGVKLAVGSAKGKGSRKPGIRFWSSTKPLWILGLGGLMATWWPCGTQIA